jgi:cysteine-rich repeat protein
MTTHRTTALCAAALVVGGAGCALLADIEEPSLLPEQEEPGVLCSTLDDCVAEASECRTAAACERGRCVFNDTADGALVASQTPGDCAAVVCDGSGSTRAAPIADAPDDGKVCTIDACEGTTPTHTAQLEVPCYTGAAGTKGVGACKAGTQECDVQGDLVGGCTGEVTPEPERCDPAAVDEDCDGEVNEEGDGCVCGDGYISAGEECDDGDLMGGDSCSATCVREQALPVAGRLHTCALLYNGNVKCWGNNQSGELGLGHTQSKGDNSGEMGANLPVINIGPGLTAKAVAAGHEHTCVLTSFSSIKCWGENSFGRLGRGDTTQIGDDPTEMGSNLSPVSLGGGFVPTAVAAGVHHTCALSASGLVKCWGANFYGALGQGHTSNIGDQSGQMGDALSAVDLGIGEQATAIAAGNDHTCALLKDGSVKCWGENDYGELGLDDTEQRGDGPGEMGDKLPSVNLGIGKQATAIAAGYGHVCVLLNDGSVKCWGENGSGQLGLGNNQHQGDEPGEMAKLPAVSLGAGKTAIAIATGAYHTCVLLNDGSLKCWGKNGSGQLGLGDAEDKGNDIGETVDTLPAVSLGSGKTATAITASWYHTCARLNNGSVKCWGSNVYGQIGLGSVDTLGDAPGEMGDSLPTVKLFSDVW